MTIFRAILKTLLVSLATLLMQVWFPSLLIRILLIAGAIVTVSAGGGVWRLLQQMPQSREVRQTPFQIGWPNGKAFFGILFMIVGVLAASGYIVVASLPTSPFYSGPQVFTAFSWWAGTSLIIWGLSERHGLTQEGNFAATYRSQIIGGRKR